MAGQHVPVLFFLVGWDQRLLDEIHMDQVFEAATTGGVLNTHSCHSGLIFEPEISARREQSIQAVLRVPQRK
jgi:hypothetical protein